MNTIVKDILNKALTNEAKLKILEEVEKDIELAKQYLSGEFEYCEECNDYYFARSFFCEKETKVGQICVFKDPINSGGNEYRTGYIDTIYKICPKGHRKIYRQDEREMKD